MVDGESDGGGPMSPIAHEESHLPLRHVMMIPQGPGLILKYERLHFQYLSSLRGGDTQIGHF